VYVLGLGGTPKKILNQIIQTFMSKLKYFSTFTGIGGFELGIGDKAECVGYSEIDKYAIQIFNKHFNYKNYGDITKIQPESLPDFDLVVGGFPCQSFSIAGKRGGFGDTRGTLFFEIARIIKQKQPRLLLLENVKGLLSHDKGATFYTIISTLDELGYDCQWQVLNSKNFGVPQNRERVFIVGHLRGTSRPEVFPIGGTNSQDIEQINKPKHSNDRVYGTNGISPTLNTMQGGNRQPFISTPQIRKLTPTECERLQGFPDGWTEGISNSQRYKTLGNAVTVNVVRAVINNLITNQIKICGKKNLINSLIWIIMVKAI
jgi:DNA (cytosine-5)-methyltransferase 1